jgi:hypothetical protein
MNHSWKPADYQAIVAAYRSTPGQHRRVAEATGFYHRTVKGIWERGIRGKSWAPAIKDTIERELAHARPTLAATPAPALPAATPEVCLDPASQRAAEASLAKLHRRVVEGGLGVMAPLLESIGRLIAKAARDIETTDELKPREILAWSTRAAAAVKQLSDAAGRLVDVERTLLGDPTEAVGLKIDTSEEGAARARQGLEVGFRALHPATATPTTEDPDATEETDDPAAA